MSICTQVCTFFWVIDPRFYQILKLPSTSLVFYFVFPKHVTTDVEQMNGNWISRWWFWCWEGHTGQPSHQGSCGSRTERWWNHQFVSIRSQRIGESSELNGLCKEKWNCEGGQNKSSKQGEASSQSKCPAVKGHRDKGPRAIRQTHQQQGRTGGWWVIKT